MSRKPVAPPEIIYEFIDDEARAIDDVFNFLFDRFFKQIGGEM